MTEITFHFNVADPTAYVCRVLRKAMRRGSQVAVSAAPDALARLDRALWAFDPVEFIPHVLLHPGQEVPDRLRGTPVWLVEEPSRLDRHEVLVNLGAQSPAGFESFAKLIEIVSTADDDRAAARMRSKHYANRGYPVAYHEVAE
ncbi:MAG TPA: DNA polymerase III subunit chi [Caldimonas sp.]